MRVTAFTGILFSLLIIAGCKTPVREEPAEPRISVRTIIVHSSEISEPIRCTGILSTKLESRLSFKTGGIIERILVDEGQNVKSGQLLAELNLEEINSQVSQAGLVLEKARRDYRRAENLYKDSVATLEQFENAGTALEVARANNRIARFNLQYSAIRAPAEGKILKRIAEVNEIIAPGHPVFLFASTKNVWIVRANLTDRDVVRVQMLDSARISFDAYRDEVFIGLISEIGTVADPYTGTYEVEIQLLRNPEKLVSGFIARLDIYPGDRKERVLVPYEALIEGTGSTGYVYVVENGIHTRRKISIGSFLDEGILVKSGLSGGEEIIIQGVPYLREGSEIEATGSNMP